MLLPGFVSSMSLCAIEISSSWNFFDQEKQTIENLLMKSYQKIEKFLESKFTTKVSTNIVHNNKSVSYYKLPYIGSYSNSNKKQI